MHNDKKWAKLEELLELQNEILSKQFGYSNEIDLLEDIRHELHEEIQKKKDEDPVDSITAEVMSKLAARSRQGVKTYSTTMDRDDLSLFSWCAHLHDELLDAAVYLQKMMRMQYDIEVLQDSMRKRTNDAK